MKKNADTNMDMGTDTSMTNGMGHYRRLLAMSLLALLSMYVLMYGMVNTFANALPNINQFYMAGLMASPMVIIELILMRSMYPDKRLNGMIMAGSVLALVVFWLLIRQQIGIGDRQFLKSMIPHHASAILMCEKATIRDPEVSKLCSDIISGQEGQIDQMKAKLKELAK